MAERLEHTGSLARSHEDTLAYLEALKGISIRGRVALGTACLEILCSAYKVEDARIRAMVDQFWSYTSSLRLDLWEDQMWGLARWVIELVEEHGYLADSATYEGWPMVVLRSIFDVHEIACIDLYGGTGAWSPNTLNWTVAALERIRKAGLQWPDLAPFMRSSFSEDGGWGLPVEHTLFRPES